MSGEGECPAVWGSTVGHDYSCLPHNTPESPRCNPADDRPCQAESADGTLGWCQHVGEYDVVVYSIGMHDWTQFRACFYCAETIKRRHAKLGPGGTEGVFSVRSRPQVASTEVKP